MQGASSAMQANPRQRSRPTTKHPIRPSDLPSNCQVIYKVIWKVLCRVRRAPLNSRLTSVLAWSRDDTSWSSESHRQNVKCANELRNAEEAMTKCLLLATMIIFVISKGAAAHEPITKKISRWLGRFRRRQWRVSSGRTAQTRNGTGKRAPLAKRITQHLNGTFIGMSIGRWFMHESARESASPTQAP